MAYVIGIDVGGTFTDVVCSDGSKTWHAKAPTNPARFSEGVIRGCELVARDCGRSLEDMLAATARFGLGTTAVTNVLATRRGQRVGVLTTKGFEAYLLGARGVRIEVDGWRVLPWNPVEEDCVVAIDERIDRNGTALQPLDEVDVRAAAEYLVNEQGVNAFAISFLWSFKYPRHEQLAASVVRELYPSLPVFVGSELRPLLGEYERMTLTALNAFTAGALNGVEELENELRAMGLSVPVLLLQSDGSVLSVSEAREVPLGAASSGPAAGAIAAAEIAGDTANALCCDMGGTSTDVAVIWEGAPERRQSAQIAGIVTGQPMIHVESIGAGGGSTAWIDARGILRVGPESARAIPGPVCYGRGGTVPAVTDAMVLLGYIDSRKFMGGAMELDVEAARAACSALGAKIGLDWRETAFGIRAIALAEMSKALRARLASGGLDPRSFSLIAFGGSGSLFATELAKDLGMPSVNTPAFASVLSAFGAATADVRVERALSFHMLLPLGDGERTEFHQALEQLRAWVESDLVAREIAPEDRTYVIELDVRIARQLDYVTLAFDRADGVLDNLADTFRAKYINRYGEAGLMANFDIELSTLRILGIGRTVRATLPTDAEIVATAPASVGNHRKVLVARGMEIDVPVYEADELRRGQYILGPALIDAPDTTLWAPPSSRVVLTQERSLITKFGE